MRKAFYGALVAAFVLGFAGTARAQATHYANKPIELNVHAGGLHLDGGDTKGMYGARLIYNMPSGWGIGGNFDWVPVDGGKYYIYNATVEYTFPSSSQLHFFADAGVGAATASPDEGDSQTNLNVPVGAGVKWFNATYDPTWGVRVDVKDQIVHSSSPSDTSNNIEFSGGVSFFFGGGGGM